MSEGFDEIYAELVREHALTASTDLAIARTIARIMCDGDADPIRAAEAITKLRALLPLKPVSAPAAPLDFALLSDGELETFGRLLSIAQGVEPPSAPTATLAALAAENQELRNKIAALEGRRSHYTYASVTTGCQCEICTGEVSRREAVAARAAGARASDDAGRHSANGEGEHASTGSPGASADNVVRLPQQSPDCQPLFSPQPFRPNPFAGAGRFDNRN